MKQNLELKGLEQFYGTQKYTKCAPFKHILTDGIMFIGESGYSWLVTDVLSILEHHPKVSSEVFVSIKFVLNGSSANVKYTDGNKKTLFEQHYNYTDAKKDLTLFATDGVLMLSSEYWGEKW